MALFAERVRWHIWEEVSPNGAPQGGPLKWTPAWNPTGTRSPPGIHPRSPARPLILRSFQTFWGGLRPGWTPKKIALTLAKFRASPPRIRFQPGGTRKINELGAEAHPVSHLVALANETDRSTLSSQDHPSAAHSPCDLEAKLHLPKKKGIPSGVSPKIVSLARRGLTGLTRHQPRNIGFEGLDRGCDLTTLIGIFPRTCSWSSDDVCKRMAMARMPSRLRVKGSGVFAQPLFT